MLVVGTRVGLHQQQSPHPLLQDLLAPPTVHIKALIEPGSCRRSAWGQAAADDCLEISFHICTL